jgi:hypothetical protein
MESEEADFTVICDEPKPDFCDLTTVALDNAGINSEKQTCAAKEDAANANMPHNINQGPALVDADDNDIAYEIILDLLDAGLGVNAIPSDTPPLPPSSSDDE